MVEHLSSKLKALSSNLGTDLLKKWQLNPISNFKSFVQLPASLQLAYGSKLALRKVGAATCSHF
jgi:hypothetical protein